MKKPLSKNPKLAETKSLNKAWVFMEEFRKVFPDIKLHSVSMFIHICQNPDTTIAEIARRIGVSEASASRNMNVFRSGKIHLRGVDRDGFGLIDIAEDFHDRRQKKVVLTHKGEAVRDSIINILSS